MVGNVGHWIKEKVFLTLQQNKIMALNAFAIFYYFYNTGKTVKKYFIKK